MGKSQLLFGRNVFSEALIANVKITEVFCENPAARLFVEGLQRQHRKNFPIQAQLPKEIRNESHQGLAFRVEHDFYLQNYEWSAEKTPIVLLCNHLEDVQNFGAVIRSAAAFGVSVIVHESRRSVSLSGAAIKASAGMAFQMKFVEVANLLTIVKDLQEEAFEIAVLEGAETSTSLYDWQPQFPVAIILGSEAEGVSVTLKNQASASIRIPMKAGVESLNVAQAASVALSWAFQKMGD